MIQLHQLVDGCACHNPLSMVRKIAGSFVSPLPLRSTKFETYLVPFLRDSWYFTPRQVLSPLQLLRRGLVKRGAKSSPSSSIRGRRSPDHDQIERNAQTLGDIDMVGARNELRYILASG